MRQWITIRNGDVTVPDFLAKQAEWYTISGRVSLPNGSGLAGVKVVIPWVAETVTDANGEYHLLYLYKGSYEISASKEGYTMAPASQQATLQDNDVTLPKFIANPVTMMTSVKMRSQGSHTRSRGSEEKDHD